MTPRKPRPPLTADTLRDLALHYVGRFATSRGKLRAYLDRKLRERGWDGEEGPEVDALVDRMAELGYVDDAGFAAMKSAAMTRRGYGARRVGEALRGAGIAEDDRAAAEAQMADGRWEAADRFARRKRIGPYAAGPADPALRQKWIAAFLRAGHDVAMARRWADAAPGDVPEREDA
ncbi:MAG: RecX family transcriptional regulator [Sphingobium sp.]|nr:RecX family transcriptional regulator [Sphingobium sp.]